MKEAVPIALLTPVVEARPEVLDGDDSHEEPRGEGEEVDAVGSVAVHALQLSDDALCRGGAGARRLLELRSPTLIH